MAAVVAIVLVLAIVIAAFKILRNGIVPNRPGASAVSRGAETIGRLMIVAIGLGIVGFVIFTQIVPPPQ